MLMGEGGFNVKATDSGLNRRDHDRKAARTSAWKQSARLPLAVAILAVASSAGAGGSGYTCKAVTGTVTLKPDDSCKITRLPLIESRFPSVVFLGEGTCFEATFTGEIGGAPVRGIAFSGLTKISEPAPGYSPDFQTAATVLLLQGWKTGALYSLDTIRFLAPDGTTAEEQLVITEGAGAFGGAKGSLGIVGNEFAGAPVKGTLCLPN
jgi:hypothetical protein